MPLIECPECGQRMASVATVCPGCSYTPSQWPVHPRKRHNSWPVPVLLVVVLLLLGILGIPKGIDNGSQPPTSSTATQLTPAAVASSSPGSQPPTSRTTTQLTPAAVASSSAGTPRTTRPRTQTTWTSTWVNVREGRGASTGVVQILEPGQPVEVNSLQGGWWVVYINDKPIGYVGNSVLQDESPSP